MICENCGKKDATFHIRQVANGVICEKHLCEECAKGYNINEFDNEFSLVEEFMEEMLLPNMITQSIEDRIIEDIVQAEGLINGIWATPIYDTQSNKKSNNILDQAKKSIVNGAKSQEKRYDENPNLKKLESLQAELQKVVDCEDYEKAAEIKKEIDKIKEQGNV